METLTTTLPAMTHEDLCESAQFSMKVMRALDALLVLTKGREAEFDEIHEIWLESVYVKTDKEKAAQSLLDG